MIGPMLSATGVLIFLVALAWAIWWNDEASFKPLALWAFGFGITLVAMPFWR